MFKKGEWKSNVDRSCGAMDSALDFGSRGCGFESHLDRFFLFPNNSKTLAFYVAQFCFFI